jgi:hypothetical protein
MMQRLAIACLCSLHSSKARLAGQFALACATWRASARMLAHVQGRLLAASLIVSLAWCAFAQRRHLNLSGAAPE